MKRSDPDYIKEWTREKSKDPEYRAKKAAYQRAYNQKNKEKAQQHRKSYYEKNADVCKEKSRAVYHTDLTLSREKLNKRRVNVPWKIMCSSAKGRSNKQGLEFSLTPEYIKSIWPENNCCPVFGTKFTKANIGDSRDASPSLDRIVPSLGYVEGNVIVVSLLANRMKNNGSLQQLKRLYDFYSGLFPDA